MYHGNYHASFKVLVDIISPPNALVVMMDMHLKNHLSKGFTYVRKMV